MSNRRRTAGVVLVEVVSLGLVGLIDHVTGRHLGLYVFYFVPVALGAWALGRRAGLAMAVAAAACWVLVDGMSDQAYPTRFYMAWNAGVRLLSFVFVSISVSTIRHMLDQERALSRQLQSALREVRVLEGLLPICASCKRIRNREGSWERLESYLGARSEVSFTHSICPTCARELYPEIELKEEGEEDPSAED